MRAPDKTKNRIIPLKIATNTYLDHNSNKEILSAYIAFLAYQITCRNNLVEYFQMKYFN